MKTYEYRFPAHGNIGNSKEAEAYTKLVEHNLKDSSDCLGAWCMFPTDGSGEATLDHVSFERDDKGNVNAVAMHTYAELWEGREDDLRSCLEENLASASQEYFAGKPMGVVVDGDVQKPEKENGQELQTYKYQFPASGSFESEADMKGYTAALEENLKASSDCLMAYCMFPTDSDILDHISFEKNENNEITAVNLHTYTELWEGMEDDLKDCLSTNLSNAGSDYFEDDRTVVNLEGDVQKLGREGEVPGTLYHIAERNSLDIIMKEGLVPAAGKNSYKSMDNYVYLASEKDLVPWLAILKHKEEPVILKVETQNIELEQGRVFSDRDYVDGKKYSEYRTKDVIPPSAISVMEPDRELSDRLVQTELLVRGVAQVKIAESSNLPMNERDEAYKGVERLKDMGFMDEEMYGALIQAREKSIESETKNEIPAADIEDEGLPWDEDDFGRAVESISAPEDMKL